MKGKINRSDFGIVLSMVSESGGIIPGEEVKILAEGQFVKQEVAEPVLV
ncbi:MAG: hypothetical protein WKI04_16050 [Ferruginibacter sp.]